MNKSELLKAVTHAAEAGTLTRMDLLRAFNARKSHDAPQLTRVLYLIGGLIVLIGIVVLIWQNWPALNSVTRILVTLGSGIAAYVLGTVFLDDERFKTLDSIFFTISGILVPLGIGVALRENSFDVGTSGIQSIISFIVLLGVLGSFYATKRNLFIVFGVIYGTWLFFAFTQFLLGDSFQYSFGEFAEYRILIVGITYMLLGYAFDNTKQDVLAGALYSFGSLGFLGAALALGGYAPNQNMFWELVYPALALGVVFLSIYLKSRSLLSIGSIFVMAYIIKISGEYFQSQLGWPLALILAGFALIAVGFISLQINRTYIKA